MLLSRVLLVGPVELPLLPPSPDAPTTDEETYALSRGHVTAWFSIDTLHTGATGIAVSVSNPHDCGDFMLPDDALVSWVVVDTATAARPDGEFRLRLESGEDPSFWLSFTLSDAVIDALRVLRDAAPLEGAVLERRTAQLQALLNPS